MGYNWRYAVWYAPDNSVYAVHGNSGHLFRYAPQTGRVDVLERITSLPSRLSGMYDQFSYGESKGVEDLHLVTWNIPGQRYADHGAIYFEDGSRPEYVNSIAVGKDGTVYCLSRISRGGIA